MTRHLIQDGAMWKEGAAPFDFDSLEYPTEIAVREGNLYLSLRTTSNMFNDFLNGSDDLVLDLKEMIREVRRNYTEHNEHD